MAIEIIHRGTALGNVTYYANCIHCWSQLKFKREDAEYVHDKRDGNALKITCPVCKNNIFIQDKR